MNIADLDWLESRKGCTRYAMPVEPGEDSESIWLCDECSEEHDPDDGQCECMTEEEECFA